MCDLCLVQVAGGNVLRVLRAVEEWRERLAAAQPDNTRIERGELGDTQCRTD